MRVVLLAPFQSRAVTPSKLDLAGEAADMLAGDDQFAALAIDMAQHGFGRGNAVQPDLAFGEVDVHGPNLLCTAPGENRASRQIDQS